MVAESDIRDHLAQNLGILEPGLTLVNKEQYLPNDKGASGFVDVLCKDAAGRLLIIEIKKSDGSARQAIHELSKYVALLKKKNLLRDSEVRLAIVSTHWHELSVPFTEFQRSSPYDCVGYTIEVKESGEITALAVAQQAKLAPVRRVSPRQHIWELGKADEPKQRIPALEKTLKQAGLEDFVLLAVTLQTEVEGINGLIYFAQQEHSLEYYLERIERNLCEDELEEFQEWIADFTEESDKVGEAADKVWDGCGTNLAVKPKGQQISYPERAMHWLSNEQAANIEVFRYGRFVDDGIDDETIISEICGHAGTSSYHLQHTVDLNSKPQVIELEHAIDEVLFSNDQWKSQFGALLEFARKNAYDTLFVRCFNNDDILKTIAGISVGQLGYTPSLEVRISKGTETLKFIGMLEWNGSVPDYNEMITAYYNNDPSMILFSQHFGGNRSINDELLSDFGISYVFIMMNSDDDPVKVRFRGMSMNTITKPLGKIIFDFVSEAPEFAGQLVSFFGNHTTEFARHLEMLPGVLLLKRCENELIEKFNIPDEPKSQKEWCGDLPECQLCKRPFSECQLMIDGAVGSNGPWANYCASCFNDVGQGIGLGKGQLYYRNGETWHMVAGA